MKCQITLSLLLGLFISITSRAAELSVDGTDSPGAFKLVTGAATANIYIAPTDTSLTRIAANLLADDIQRVTGKRPNVIDNIFAVNGNAIILGSIGNNVYIDQLAASKKINIDDIRGKWETYKLAVVENPLPNSNIQSALVIVGSDRRSAAYGAFTLSEAIGVSPWYWWADVTPAHRDALFVKPATIQDGPPSVKYRGIFINDEDWGLQPWAAKTFDTEFKDIGPRTYARVFELMLRLKLNYIWPAMHNCTIEFGKVDGNIKLADEWGIVAGASHPEGMNRNNVDWPTLGKGEWRFDTNAPAMISFWEEWAKKRGPYEAVWTIGMRGVHDAPMLPVNADMPTKVKLLEGALAAQRELLAKYVNPDIEKVAQVFCPYKEALQQYRAGLHVPEDVIICWTEDNFGYIRQLSNPTEQQRKGGSGVYYHISYLGSPFSYVWINTTPPALIWEEMTKAYSYGADRMWMLNVGDIKPGEVGMQFWAKLGWNIDSYKRETIPTYLNDWATSIFASQEAAHIAAIMDRHFRLGFARKPESLHRNPDCFSAANYDEAQQRLADYQELLADAESLNSKIPAERRDAYLELVLYPVRMAALTNQAFVGSSLSRHFASQNDPLANSYAAMSEQATIRMESETNSYNNDLAGGKWRGMMTVRGTTSGTYGFRWPQATKLNGNTAQPPIPLKLERRKTAGANPSFAEYQGVISIEAEHPTRNVARNGAQWQVIPGLGRSGDSMAVFPVTVASVDQPQNIASQSPAMEYDLANATIGEFEVTTYCLPTRRINDARGLRYAIAIDDEQPQVVDFNQLNEDQRWQQNVMQNASINVTKHKLSSAGNHTLKIWMVDPGVVIDKIVINTGGLKPSYLGPPETLK